MLQLFNFHVYNNRFNCYFSWNHQTIGFVIVNFEQIPHIASLKVVAMIVFDVAAKVLDTEKFL